MKRIILAARVGVLASVPLAGKSHADEATFKEALNKLPTIGDWAIDSGTLIIYPTPAHQHNARTIAKVLCLSKKANNVQSFDLIRMMDSIKYLRTKEHSVLLRQSCKK